MRDALFEGLPEPAANPKRAKTKMVGVNENGCRVGGYHGRAKITDHEVDLIRELHEEHGLSVRQIAEKFEVGRSTIGDIVSYRTRVSIPINFRMVKVKEEVVTEHKEKMRIKQMIRDEYYRNHATPMTGVAAGTNRNTGLPHVHAREIERNARRAK